MILGTHAGRDHVQSCPAAQRDSRQRSHHWQAIRPSKSRPLGSRFLQVFRGPQRNTSLRHPHRKSKLKNSNPSRSNPQQTQLLPFNQRFCCPKCAASATAPILSIRSRCLRSRRQKLQRRPGCATAPGVTTIPTSDFAEPSFLSRLHDFTV